jgi:deoxyribodipyrimidine photolyase-related protein
VIALVRDTWPDDAPGSYGSLDAFGWPVTPEQAEAALDDFVTERLSRFGNHQDAMWSGEPFLYHALLSPALNLKLIRPARVVEAVLAAYASGAAPLNAVEGFVRQVVGWREFVRGVYQHEDPDYEQRNALEQHGALPDFYWTGESGMACVDDSVARVLEHAYGHHIERLMVLGNLALIAGVSPQAIHGWFLAMYADAVAWVTAPNTIGMSQHADGGVVGTKPYAASGKYVQRMSNYCADCRYDVRQRLGDEACPLNALYWDFLIRQREALRPNRRMAMILANVDRLDEAERDAIRERARTLREDWGVKSKD